MFRFALIFWGVFCASLSFAQESIVEGQIYHSPASPLILEYQATRLNTGQIILQVHLYTTPTWTGDARLQLEIPQNAAVVQGDLEETVWVDEQGIDRIYRIDGADQVHFKALLSKGFGAAQVQCSFPQKAPKSLPLIPVKNLDHPVDIQGIPIQEVIPLSAERPKH